MKEKPSKKAKKSEKTAETKKAENLDIAKGKYFGAVGSRKRAVARVRIFDCRGDESQKGIEIIVNGRPYEKYFSLPRHRETAASPFLTAGEKAGFSVSVVVRGGGEKGQSEAVRLGISRALVLMSEGLKKPLRDAGFLTRDSRVVERKKAGLKKARRAPQWQKR
jgi:small subunit ribosomal protein S9